MNFLQHHNVENVSLFLYKMNILLKIIISIFLLLTICPQGNAEPFRRKKIHRHTRAELKERLTSMKSAAKPVRHASVLYSVESHVYRARKGTSTVIGRASVYFPIFEHYLDLYGLPKELKYIAAWESRLDPTAVSHAGASGLWQLMPGTARKYGLTVNSRIDERFDVNKATEAAALYLTDLYEMFGDWTVVMAAYNCGEGTVMRAMRRSGHRNYWKLRPYLPKETAGYVPSILGTTYALQYYQYYDIRPIYPDYTEQMLRTTVIHKGVSFKEIAKITGLSRREVKRLNPAYRRKYIYPNKNGNYVRLPEQEAARFRDIWLKRERLSNFRKVNISKKTSSTDDRASYPVMCLVRPGDSLEYLAELYKVPRKKIIEWNDLQTNRLAAFQELLIYVPVKNKTKVREKNWSE